MGGPGHASDGDCLPGEILLKTVDFERPGGREWLPSGTPFQKNYIFWKGFRTRACTNFLNKLSQERFFLQRQKSEWQISYGVRGMGPPLGPAFACTVTTINKTKKQKTNQTKYKFC